MLLLRTHVLMDREDARGYREDPSLKPTPVILRQDRGLPQCRPMIYPLRVHLHSRNASVHVPFADECVHMKVHLVQIISFDQCKVESNQYSLGENFGSCCESS